MNLLNNTKPSIFLSILLSILIVSTTYFILLCNTLIIKYINIFIIKYVTSINHSISDQIFSLVLLSLLVLTIDVTIRKIIKNRKNSTYIKLISYFSIIFSIMILITLFLTISFQLQPNLLIGGN